MKKIMSLFSFFLFLALTTVSAQQTDYETYFDEINTSSNQIIKNVNSLNKSLKSFTIKYYLFNDTKNINSFNNNALEKVGELRDFNEEILDFTLSIKEKNNQINLSKLNSYLKENFISIEKLNTDYKNLVNAVKINDKNKYRRAYINIKKRFKLIRINTNNIKTEAAKLENIPFKNTYNVKIKLVDRYGKSVPVETIDGYVATNKLTNKLYYDVEEQGDEIGVFKNLPAGTYLFDGYDGHFDGTGSATITLSKNLVNNEGFIIIDLPYWSE